MFARFGDDDNTGTRRNWSGRSDQGSALEDDAIDDSHGAMIGDVEQDQ